MITAPRGPGPAASYGDHADLDVLGLTRGRPRLAPVGDALCPWRAGTAWPLWPWPGSSPRGAARGPAGPQATTGTRVAADCGFDAETHPDLQGDVELAGVDALAGGRLVNGAAGARPWSTCTRDVAVNVR